MSDISVEEVEDVIAIWQPAIDAYNELIKRIRKAAPQLSDEEIRSLSKDIITTTTNEYMKSLWDSPSPW